MSTRLTTRLGVAGVAAAVMLSIAISPVYAVDEPVDDLTATEPTQENMPTVGGEPRQPALLGARSDHEEQPRSARTGLAHPRLGGHACLG